MLVNTTVGHNESVLELEILMKRFLNGNVSATSMAVSQDTFQTHVNQYEKKLQKIFIHLSSSEKIFLHTAGK